MDSKALYFIEVPPLPKPHCPQVPPPSQISRLLYSNKVCSSGFQTGVYLLSDSEACTVAMGANNVVIPFHLSGSNSESGIWHILQSTVYNTVWWVCMISNSPCTYNCVWGFTSSLLISLVLLLLTRTAKRMRSCCCQSFSSFQLLSGPNFILLISVYIFCQGFQCSFSFLFFSLVL